MNVIQLVINPDLLEKMDRLTDNRSRYIREALSEKIEREAVEAAPHQNLDTPAQTEMTKQNV